MNNCEDDDHVIQATKNWLEKFVIKHNFCPFAVKPFRDKQIRYVNCQAINETELTEKLIDEILLLQGTDQQQIETTLVVIPLMFESFFEYNQYLDMVDAIIVELQVVGVIQVASFHPEYQFADLEIDDIRNYTNRSPYPMFHLIREDSIEKARELMDTEAIPNRNMNLLLELGLAGIVKDKN